MARDVPNRARGDGHSASSRAYESMLIRRDVLTNTNTQATCRSPDDRKLICVWLHRPKLLHGASITLA